MPQLDGTKKAIGNPSPVLWAVHVGALLSVVAWALLDMQFESVMGTLRSSVDSQSDWFDDAAQHIGWMRVSLLLGVLLIGVISLGGIIGHRFRPSLSQRSRSIRSLLAIVSVVALWCSIAANYPAIAWQGQRIRVGLQIQQLESFTEPLREDWPERDGEIPEVGPFMAYPFGRPTVLVLLSSPTLANDDFSIAAIERSERGAIKLQLSGTDHDDWAEWHPAGSEPASFVGGLSDRHDLESTANLGQGWSLVRYRTSAAG